MQDYINEILHRINEEMELLDIDENVCVEDALHMIDVIRPLFDNLRSMTVKYEFQNEEEEIHFFKDIKPDILSRYLYFYKITRIEMKRPIGSDDVQREYLHCQLDNLKYFFDQNLDFYQYYRSKATHLDSYYFVRYKANFRLCVDSAFLDKDPAFSTGYDYKVAKILSNEMLRIYLNRQLQLLDRKMQISKIRAALSDFNLKWTGSKSDAVEFGYGLVAIATLNNGNVTIKEIMAFIEAALVLRFRRLLSNISNSQKQKEKSNCLFYISNRTTVKANGIGRTVIKIFSPHKNYQVITNLVVFVFIRFRYEMWHFRVITPCFCY